MNKYEQFWNFFSDHQESFFHQLEEHVDDYVLLIQEQLEMVNEHLAFEISELLDSNKRELIISADGMHCAFEDVLLLGEYQREYQRWIITLFRQPENTNKHSIELDDLVLSYDDIFYCLNVSENVTINVYIKNYVKEDNRFVHLYFLLLDSLIGEYQSVMLIDETTVSLYEFQDNVKPFVELKEEIKRLK